MAGDRAGGRSGGGPNCACLCGAEVVKPARKWVPGHRKNNPGPVSPLWVHTEGTAMGELNPTDYVMLRVKHAFWLGICAMLSALRYDETEAREIERSGNHLSVWAGWARDLGEAHTPVRRDHLFVAVMTFSTALDDTPEDDEPGEDTRFARAAAFNAGVHRMALPIWSAL